MTEVLKEAFKVYPENRNVPGVDSNEDLRNAYIKGAVDFCRNIWAMVKVEETRLAGRYSDEKVSLVTFSNKLNQISDYCHELYNEPKTEEDF